MQVNEYKISIEVNKTPREIFIILIEEWNKMRGKISDHDVIFRLKEIQKEAKFLMDNFSYQLKDIKEIPFIYEYNEFNEFTQRREIKEMRFI